MSPTNISNSSEERKRLLQSFFNLPPQDKAMFYQALEHLRWLLILWDLDELDLASMPNAAEKRRILLAYKHLQMLWFDRLPERDNETFMIHVRDRFPDDQTPEIVNKAFDRTAEELADLCRDIPRPMWLNDSIEVKTSIELFPQKVP